jgi:hypothetical protein
MMTKPLRLASQLGEMPPHLPHETLRRRSAKLA